MKRKTISLSLFLFFALLLSAQEEIALFEKKMDSLKLILEQLPEDTTRFEVLKQLSRTALRGTDAKTCTQYAEEYLALAKTLKSEPHLAFAYRKLVYNISFFDLELYEKRSKEGENYFKTQKDTIGLIHTLVNKSLYYSDDLSDEERAIECLDEARSLSEQVKYVKIMPRIWLYSGRLLVQLKNCEAAIPFFDKAITSKTAIPYTRAFALSEKGDCYISMNRFDSVAYFHNQALEIARKDNDLLGMQFSYASLGDFYLKQDNFEQAKAYYQKIEPLAVINNCDCTPLAEAYQEIGAYYKNKNQVDSAIVFLEKSIEQAAFERQFNEQVQITNRKSHRLLSEIYEQQKTWESAFYHSKQYKIFSDSALQLEGIVAAEEMNVQYKTAEKERQISALHDDNALLSNKNKAYLIAMLGIGLGAIISFLFFLNIRKKNKLISEQKVHLEQLNLTKDRLFTIIGHDMRKPVLAFRGIGKKVNYLLQKQDYNTLSALGDSIEKDAMSLNKLTDNLLNWALTQKNVLPYNPELIDLVSLVEETITIFQKISKDKNITLISSIGKGIKVYADRNTLLTIVRNLVDNAIKFTTENGTVEIIAVIEKNNVKLEVKDNGTGIPPQKLKDIFLLKEDKSQEGTAGEQGTGLGLHLVHELVQLNKGAINVISNLNEGSRFEVILPSTKLA